MLKKFFLISLPIAIAIILFGWLMLQAGIESRGAVARGSGQQLETANYVLAAPLIDTDRHDGYPYELRGNLYKAGTIVTCDSQPSLSRVGTWVLKGRIRQGSLYQGTWIIRTGEASAIQAGTARQFVWDGISQFILSPEESLQTSFTYEALITNPNQGKWAIVTFTPFSDRCLIGSLQVIYLQ